MTSVPELPGATPPSTLASRSVPWTLLVLTFVAAATMDSKGTTAVWLCWSVVWLRSQHRLSSQRGWTRLGRALSIGLSAGVTGLFVGLAATVATTSADTGRLRVHAGFPFVADAGLGPPPPMRDAILHDFSLAPSDLGFHGMPCFSESLPCLANLLCFAVPAIALAWLLPARWQLRVQQVARYIALVSIAVGLDAVMRYSPNAFGY